MHDKIKIIIVLSGNHDNYDKKLMGVAIDIGASAYRKVFVTYVHAELTVRTYMVEMIVLG